MRFSFVRLSLVLCFAATVTGCRTELWPEVLTNNPQDLGGGDGAKNVDQAKSDLPTKPSPDLRQPTGPQVGDPCSGQGSCGPDLICFSENSGFPGGYCSRECGDFDQCPDGSVCLPVGNRLGCFKACGSSNECRPNYECDPNDTVCVPAQTNGNELPPGTNNGKACVQPTQEPQPDQVAPNVRVSQANHWATHATVAVDATNDRLAVAWYDYAQNGTDGIKVAVSTDDGATFGTAINLPRGAGMATPFVYYPYLVADSEGTFYVSWLGYAGNQQAITAMNVFVARSTDGGKTFTVVRATPTDEFVTDGSLDAPRVAVAPDKSLVLTWTQYDPNAGVVNIRLSRSTDQGATWSAPITISESEDRAFAYRSLASTAFDAASNAYVVWVEYEQDYWGSTDNAVYVQKLDAMGPSGANLKASAGSDSPAYDWPSIAVVGPSIVVGFASGTASGAWDVRLAVATTGTTFSSSLKLNDDATCATHFHHALRAGADGTLHAIWYDNRYLVGNVFSASAKIDPDTGLLVAESSFFVNSQSFPFTTAAQDFNALSDYLGLTTVGDQVYSTWTDPRSNDIASAYFAKVFF